MASRKRVTASRGIATEVGGSLLAKSKRRKSCAVSDRCFGQLPHMNVVRQAQAGRSVGAASLSGDVLQLHLRHCDLDISVIDCKER